MNLNSPDVLTTILLAICIIVIFGMMILWFAMLLDAFKNPNQQPVKWVVILICFGSFGGIIYYFAVYRKRKKLFPAPIDEPPIKPFSMQ